MNLDHDFTCDYRGDKSIVLARNARQAALALARARLQAGDRQESYAIRVSFALATTAFVIDLHEIDPSAPVPRHVPRQSRAPNAHPRVTRARNVSRYTSGHDDLP